MNMPPTPRFDPTINLGHVLTACAFLASAGGAYFALKSDISTMAYRVTTIEVAAARTSEAIERLTAVIVTAARQEERVTYIERRIDASERRLERLERRPSSPQ